MELSNGTDRRETLKCRTGEVPSFIMSSEVRRGNPLRFIVPIALVMVIAVGAGYYSAYAKNSGAPVVWNINPIQIKFNTSDGFSGSVPDSFTCSPTVSPVTLVATSNNPSIISITVSPSSFSTCKSTAPDSVVITASCTPAFQNASCDGDQYQGLIQVCGPSPYT